MISYSYFYLGGFFFFNEISVDNTFERKKELHGSLQCFETR